MSEDKSGYEKILEKIKSTSSVLKEIGFMLLFLFLICNPACLKGKLVEAGFQKGTIAGFEWRNEIEKSSEQSRQVATNVSQIDEKLKQFSDRLKNIENRVADPGIKKEVNNLQIEVQNTQKDARNANAAIQQNIVTQALISESINSSEQSPDGWVYLGKMKAGKAEWFNPTEPVTIDPVQLPLKVGQIVSIRDAAYIRENTPPRSSAKVLGVFRVGEKGEISELDFVETPEKDFYVWAKLKKYKEIH